jgi:putative ribosome biogenesis GTPase RsgA
MSSKSPRTRAQQHPSQERSHRAAAAAAAEAIAHSQSPQTAFVAADDAAAAAALPSHTITLESRLVYAEPSSKGTGRHPAPQAPTIVDQSGRAALRTKLHPEGAIVGRGRVVANFGTRMLVQEIPWNEEAAAAAAAAEAAKAGSSGADESEPTEGIRFIALPRGKLGKIVCGDVVLWEWSSNHADSSAFIVEVLPRHTEFRRADKQSKGREEVLLASNFNHMCIVCASQPATNATLLDRYIAAASRMGVGSSIIFNKQDLAEARNFDEIFADYERVGVRVFRTSCAPDHIEGIEELRQHLATVGPDGKSGITIFVGQSGSGQSSAAVASHRAHLVSEIRACRM